MRNEMVIAGEIADLEAGSQVSTAIRKGFMQRSLVHDFAREALKLLSQQLSTIDNREPLKMLWVAEDQAAAKLAAEEINKAAGRDFARLVISDNTDALGTLRAAAREPHPCAIVAVRMVTEGLDCPQVSVIAYAYAYAYASATTAVLFLAQTMACAMRVTGTERADRMLLPAQILIPNNPALRSAFAEALVGHFHILEVPDEPDGTSRGDGTGGVLRMPRYQLTDMSSLDLHSATVLGEPDGTVMATELEAAIAICLELSIPEPYAPRVAVASRKLGPYLPLYTKTSTVSIGLQHRAADARTLNKTRRTRIKAVSGWMNHHVPHDSRFDSIGVFQGQANDAAGLPAVKGRENATPEQLALVEGWMLARIREHCDVHGCALPKDARGDSRE